MYKLTENDNCVINLDNGHFTNADIDEEYLKWLADGNTPQLRLFTKAEIDGHAASLVPASVQMGQARRALLRANLLHLVDSFFASMPGVEGDEARICWEYEDVRRNHPLVALLGEKLGLNSDQLDELFITAAAL